MNIAVIARYSAYPGSDIPPVSPLENRRRMKDADKKDDRCRAEGER
jgi:hypothetical protein